MKTFTTMLAAALVLALTVPAMALGPVNEVWRGFLHLLRRKRHADTPRRG